MYRSPDPDRASSPVIGVFLVIGITFILAMLVLILCSGYRFLAGSDVRYFPDENDNLHPGYSRNSNTGSRTVSDTGSKDYRNRYLGVITYVKRARANCNIPTLNNELFCSLKAFVGFERAEQFIVQGGDIAVCPRTIHIRNHPKEVPVLVIFNRYWNGSRPGAHLQKNIPGCGLSFLIRKIHPRNQLRQITGTRCTK